MTGPPCPVLEDNTVPPARPVLSYVRVASRQFVHSTSSQRASCPMVACLVCVVFLVWLFALAEQVTAVRDVLCLSHKPKSNRSESVVRVATEPLLSPRVLCSLSPPLCTTVYTLVDP